MSIESKLSFLLYLEYEELINELTNEEAGELIKAVFEYEKTGQTPALSPLVKVVFISIRQDLDRNAEKYDARVRASQLNGMKGGRPKKQVETMSKSESGDRKEDEKNLENLTVISENLKKLNDNDNGNENGNENVISLSNEKEITREERDILEKYIEKKKLATKNVKAYASKLISNGDWRDIVKSELKKTLSDKPKMSREERIRADLASIHDKRSCAKILAYYNNQGSPPPSEFDEVMEKYDLDTYQKLLDYAEELSRNKG